MQKFMPVRVFLLSLAFIMILSPLQSAKAGATADPGSSTIPIEIEPVCSDSINSQAHWKVTNKNPADVNVNWTNLYNNATGDHSAVPGVSQMLTAYAANDANNTTRFMSGPDTNQTNATKVPCTPEVPVEPAPTDCVDGHNQQNLVVTWVAEDTVAVSTKDSKPVCEDEEIYFSSYIMPENYDGNGFENNSTAYPQAIYSSTSATLRKNTVASEVMRINLPDECENVQVDVYYAPEITNVGPDGHGTQNIESRIYESSGECDGGLGSGDNGGSAGVPVQPAAVGGAGADVVAATGNLPVMPLPDELPKTGSNLLLTLLTIPLVIGALSYRLAYQYQARRR